MATITLTSGPLLDSDPLYNPVLIVGKLKNLTTVEFETLKGKFSGKVSEEVSFGLGLW